MIGENGSLAVIWSGSRLHNNFLGIKKLTVIWSASRICSNALGIVAKFAGDRGLVSDCYLVGSRL